VELIMTSNQLDAIPDIGSLIHLEELYWSNNSILTLPIEMRALTNLRRLDLSQNALRTLPNEIGGLIALKFLDVSQNQLNALPSEIGTLVCLDSLALGCNQLNSLPNEMRGLTSLTYLQLSANQLKTLPGAIFECSNLVELHLDDNQLSTLPNELGGLVNLSTLYLDGNGLVFPHQSIGTPMTSITFDPKSHRVSFPLPWSVGNYHKYPLAVQAIIKTLVLTSQAHSDASSASPFRRLPKDVLFLLFLFVSHEFSRSVPVDCSSGNYRCFCEEFGEASDENEQTH
jgi:hypothetical protein